MPEGTNKYQILKILSIVHKILAFNEQDQNQFGHGLKILTPNQILSRLPFSLAQLKAKIILKNLKTKLCNYCILCTDQKNLLKNSTKLCFTFFLRMETIFMNIENSKTNKSRRFRLNLTDKFDLKDPKENMTLSNLIIYYTRKNIKSDYNNNKFKISAPTWNDTFDLPDGSYSIFGIQDYFEFIIKKYRTLTENPPVQIYQNKIKNRLQIRIVNS